MVVYDRKHDITSILYELPGRVSERDFAYRLRSLKAATPIPTFFYLLEFEARSASWYQDYMLFLTELAAIRKSLNVETAQYSAAFTECLDDYSDLGKASLQLTKLVQRAEKWRFNLRNLQCFVPAVYEMHEEYRKSMPEPNSGRLIMCWTDIRDRLGYYSMRLSGWQSVLETHIKSIHALNSEYINSMACS